MLIDTKGHPLAEHKRVIISEKDGVTIHTIPASPRPGPDERCCHAMRIGTRGKFPRSGRAGSKSYSLRAGKRKPCPNRATVYIDGKPYCSAHANIMTD